MYHDFLLYVGMYVVAFEKAVFPPEFGSFSDTKQLGRYPEFQNEQPFAASKVEALSIPIA